MMKNEFNWISFYEAIANKLLTFSHKRKELMQRIRDLSATIPLLQYLHFEDQSIWAERDFEIDPFTVMAMFNRGVTDEHRTDIANKLAAILGVSISAPKSFHGIPHLDPRHSRYSGNNEMWELFETAISDNGQYGKNFANAYNAAKNISGNGLGALSIGLFWIRPKNFMPLDKISCPFLKETFDIDCLPEKCDSDEYIETMHDIISALKTHPNIAGFPGIAFAAWQQMHG